MTLLSPLWPAAAGSDRPRISTNARAQRPAPAKTSNDRRCRRHRREHAQARPRQLHAGRRAGRASSGTCGECRGCATAVTASWPGLPPRLHPLLPRLEHQPTKPLLQRGAAGGYRRAATIAGENEVAGVATRQAVEYLAQRRRERDDVRFRLAGPALHASAGNAPRGALDLRPARTATRRASIPLRSSSVGSADAAVRAARWRLEASRARRR